MGIREYIFHDEHWVVNRIPESLYCIPEMNTTLYVNYTRIKKLNKKDRDLSYGLKKNQYALYNILYVTHSMLCTIHLCKKLCKTS